VTVPQPREPNHGPLVDVGRAVSPATDAVGRHGFRTVAGDAARDAIVVSDMADDALRCNVLPRAFVMPSLALACRALEVNGRQITLEFGIYR
jgi:hypothetical protein